MLLAVFLIDRIEMHHPHAFVLALLSSVERDVSTSFGFMISSPISSSIPGSSLRYPLKSPLIKEKQSLFIRQYVQLILLLRN